MPYDDPPCFHVDRIPVRSIHWLWRPYLACGKLAVLDGDPGAGKSLLTADLAVRLARGVLTPDGFGNGPIRPCRTAPDDADEGKADRPPSRAESALRPWPAQGCVILLGCFFTLGGRP